MSKVVFMMSVSVDGFFEGPNRDIGWSSVGEEMLEYINDDLEPAAAFLEGRVTYELMEGYWPSADADPGTPRQVARFAKIWRGMPKVVFSRTLDTVGPNASLRRTVDAAEIADLKRSAGGDLITGGADLGAEFLRLDLIDEYRIYVHPVVVGAGRTMFSGAAQIHPLHLIQTRAFGNGVVLSRYRPVDRDATD